ncbi:MAG: MerR family transcriptional regulator [Giesbergeria sp.]
MGSVLPPIPAKRYFTIGEVAELCAVKPHVLRYWEQEFTQLRPMKRRGNRRYYQHHEVLMIRRIRDLLYDQGFTISGARNRLQDGAHNASSFESESLQESPGSGHGFQSVPHAAGHAVLPVDMETVRRELLEIRGMLSIAS